MPHSPYSMVYELYIHIHKWLMRPIIVKATMCMSPSHNYCWRPTRSCLHNYWLLLIMLHMYSLYTYVYICICMYSSKTAVPAHTATLSRPYSGHIAGDSQPFQQYHAEEIGYTTPIILTRKVCVKMKSFLIILSEIQWAYVQEK